MTDYAFWTDNQLVGGIDGSAMARHGGHNDGWIVPPTAVLIADDVTGLASGPYNAFENTGQSGLDVSFANGEAMVYGGPLARDTSTTITLTDNQNNQVVYVGYEPLSNNQVVIGVESDFTDEARKVSIWEFDTANGSVTATTDQRTIDETIAVRNSRYETTDGSGVAVDSAESIGNIQASDIARTDVEETFTQTVTFDNEGDGFAVEVIGRNELDSDVVVIDGDADTSQNDDLLKIRSVSDITTGRPDDSNTDFVVQGGSGVAGAVGINTPTPTREFDLNGDMIVSGVSEFEDDVAINTSLDVNNSTTTERLAVVEDTDGVTMSVAAGDRFFIAPRVNDNPQFGSEITYHSGIDAWEVESSLLVRSDFAVRSSAGEYDIQKNGTDANGVINFKTS